MTQQTEEEGQQQKERIMRKNKTICTSSKSIKSRLAPNSQPNSQHTHTHPRTHTQRKLTHRTHVTKQSPLSYPHTHYKTPHSSADSLNISSGSQHTHNTQHTHTHTKTKQNTKDCIQCMNIVASQSLHKRKEYTMVRRQVRMYVCVYSSFT